MAETFEVRDRAKRDSRGGFLVHGVNHDVAVVEREKYGWPGSRA